jgi:predicted RNA-binding Zn ribbon-like protein
VRAHGRKLTANNVLTGKNTASLADGVASWAEPSLPQPGARAPAPGELALIQAFLNSHYDLEREHGADLFASRAALTQWLTRRRLLPPGGTVTQSELQRVRTVREGLRTLARANGEPGQRISAGELAGLDEAARGAVLAVRFGKDGPHLVAGGPPGVGLVLATVLAITVRASLDGTWARLKVCPGDHCGWVFYDHSRNQSSRWCSMAVCGGRAKARSHYRRRGRGVG